MSAFIPDIQKVLIGLDIGSCKTIVVLKDGEIIRNELGGISTATLVAFHSRERLIGESGVQQASASPQTAVTKINRLLGGTEDSFPLEIFSRTARFPFSYDEQKKLCVDIECHGRMEHFSPEALLAMVLVKIGRQVQTAVGSDSEIEFVASVPADFTAQQSLALADAMAIAGLKPAKTLSTPHCLAAALGTKYPVVADEGQPGPVAVIFDMGQTQTSVSIVTITQGNCTLLGFASDYRLGCLDFDVKIFELLLSKHNLESAGVSLSQKSGSRLLDACEKLRKLVSTLPSAEITVEMLVNDRDFNFSLSRDDLSTSCAELLGRIQSLCKDALSKAQSLMNDTPISSIELMGGGSRMPLVQNILKEEFGDVLIGQKLDDSSAAYGAVLLQSKINNPYVPPVPLSASDECNASSNSMEVETPSDPPVETMVVEPQQEDKDESPQLTGLSSEEIAAATEKELKMQQEDEEFRAIGHWRNAIEAFVFEMRGALSGKYANLLNREVFGPFLDTCEDWFYSDEASEANLDQMKLKHDEIVDKAKELGKDYFEKLEEDQKKMEAELDEESKRAEAERASQGDDDDDHDNRKLKKPERMRMVVKNKEEGNELFKDGNWRPAAARYVKALSHASKFFDLSPDDEKEVKEVKISLYMNLAKCYLKMDNLDKMLSNCNDALSYDAENAKALYMRAFCYEKKGHFDKAEADLKIALSKNSEDQPSVKLMERVKAQLKREKEKEKKMWSKAFA